MKIAVKGFVRLVLGLLMMIPLALGQNSARVTGQVLDPSGDPVNEVSITLSNMLTGFLQKTVTNEGGKFELTNLPFHSYQLTVEKEGFRPEQRTADLISNIPVALSIQLHIQEKVETVEVSAVEGKGLVDVNATGTKVELNLSTMERIPTPISTRGVESLLLTFPGFAADANGAIHPRGAHNQMTFVIDGMAISDQLTGSFAGSLDPSIVQTIELYTGNIPAEYGSKISGVANITTRSGIGTGRRMTGSVQLGASDFDTLSNVIQLGGEVGRIGYFASFFSIKSHRFLDQVSLDNLQNGGNAERGFSRLDFSLTPANQLRVDLLAGRSSFELANLRSQQWAGQSQRQLLRDVSVSLGWLRTLSPRATLDSMVSYRTAIAQLFPSSGDTPVTAAQARHLSTLTAGSRFNVIWGSHTFRVGGDYLQFPVSENFSFGVTDPKFNEPGSPKYNPALLAFDLSRGGQLFYFSKKSSGQLLSFFIQDEMRWRRFLFSVGLRFDRYSFLVNGHQLQPRVGVSFYMKETETVLRASYNRTYQTPPNENLLLSNSEEASVLIPPSVREALGGGVIRIRPERQNVYEVGLQQGIGHQVSLNLSYYHKDSVDMQDNDNFFNSGIIFPTSLKQSRTNGAELRLSIPSWRKFSGSLSLTHYHTIVTPPFTGGLFIGSAAIDSLNSGPFVIDHDQTLGAQGLLRYELPRGFWTSTSVRYDSGLVCNPSDPTVVVRDPDYRDLLPYVNLGSNPPRVRPRTLVDWGVGYQRLRDQRLRWDVQGQVTNITNQIALYNFQSIFVGTRLVQPRTFGIKLRWFW
jgi:outer membrane receptor for ferrienterochelin and colicin